MTQRAPRKRSKDYLGFIAALPCVACLARSGQFVHPVQVAHLRSGSIEHGKRPTGGAEKPDDRWTTPLCWLCHGSQHHRGDELLWWEDIGIEPFGLCQALQSAFDQGQSGKVVIISAAAAVRSRQVGQ